MLKYPMSFKTSADSPSGIQIPWTSQSAESPAVVPMAIPPKFCGPGGHFSPEDLYAMALQNCFIASFKVFAEKSKLEFDNLHIDAELVVDRNDKGQPWMARVHLNISLTGVQQIENARRLLEKTSQACMILNSVNTVKTFNFHLA